VIIEQKIDAILATVTGCTFWPVQLLNGDSAIPAAFGIYLKVGGTGFSDLAGDIDISRPRIQISVYACDYGTVKTLESAVMAAMKNANDLANAAVDAGQDPLTATGALPNVSASVPVDGHDSDTQRFYVHLDFYCWVRE